MSAQLRFRARIVPLNQKANWFNARNSAGENGVAPNKLLDLHLLDETYRRTLSQAELQAIDKAFPLWAREAFGHAGKGKQFERGKHISDESTGLFLGASHLEYLSGDPFRSETGLFITPNTVVDRKHGTKTVVEIGPSNIAVLYPIIQSSDGKGKLHEETAMPLQLTEEDLRAGVAKRGFKHIEARTLCTMERGKTFMSDEDVIVLSVPTNESGVATFTYDFVDDKNNVLARDVSLADINRIARGQSPDSDELARFSREQLEAAVAISTIF